MDELKERVFKIIVEHMGIERSKISLSSDFVDDIGADSLDTVELVMAFEEEFEIEIADEVAENFTKVGEVVAYLKSRGY